MGIFSALLPILYILGRRDAQQIHERKELEKDIINEKKKSDFYKAMEQDHNQTDPSNIDSRDDLINRLRNKGI